MSSTTSLSETIPVQAVVLPQTKMVSSQIREISTVKDASQETGTLKRVATKVATLFVSCFVTYIVYSNSLILIPTSIARLYFWMKRKDLASSLALARLEALKRGLEIIIGKKGETEIKISTIITQTEAGRWDPLWEGINMEGMEWETVNTDSWEDRNRATFEKYKKDVLLLIELIHKPPSLITSYQTHVEEEIRPLLSRIYKSPIYKVYKEFENPSIKFLQNIAAEFYVGADGTEAFKAMGEREAEHELPEDCNFVNVKEALDASVVSGINLNKNSTLNSLLYTLLHPFKVSHSVEGMVDKLGYNACASGNGYNTWGSLKFGEVDIVHILGPGVTGDHVYDMYLDFLKSNKSHTLRHDLQSMSVSSEVPRVIKVTRKAGKSKRTDQFRYFRTDFNGPTWKMKTTAMEALTGQKKASIIAKTFIDDFMDNYSKEVKGETSEYSEEEAENLHGQAHRHITTHDQEVKGETSEYSEEDSEEEAENLHGQAHRHITTHDNGYYFNKNDLSDSDLELAFAYSRQLFIDLLNQTDAAEMLNEMMKTPKGRRRFGQMMQLVTQEFMVAAVLAKTSKTDSSNALAQVSFSQACKQDVDRGVAHNILIHLFSKVHNNLPITRDDVCSIVGVANRAIVVDHRKMMIDKYQPLADFLQLVGMHKNVLKENLDSFLEQLQKR